MATPLAKAAKRGGTRRAEPITVLAPPAQPRSLRYSSTNRPLSATWPASAKPTPSRMERLAKRCTFGGTASSRTPAMNSATYMVNDIRYTLSFSATAARRSGRQKEQRCSERPSRPGVRLPGGTVLAPSGEPEYKFGDAVGVFEALAAGERRRVQARPLQWRVGIEAVGDRAGKHLVHGNPALPD